MTSQQMMQKSDKVPIPGKHLHGIAGLDAPLRSKPDLQRIQLAWKQAAQAAGSEPAPHVYLMAHDTSVQTYELFHKTLPMGRVCAQWKY